MRKHILFGILFGAAVLCSTGVQAQKPESYESLMKSGNTKFAANDYISAKTYYEMALKQKPNDAEAKKKLDQTLVKIQQDSERQPTSTPAMPSTPRTNMRKPSPSTTRP